MVISRVKAGCFMVSGSIALFGLAAILTDDSQPATKAAVITPFQNLFVIVSVILMIVGILFRAVKQDLSFMRRKSHPFRSRVQILRNSF